MTNHTTSERHHGVPAGSRAGSFEQPQDGVTLQINLSGGDVDYAALTVPWLVEAHRGSVREVLLVVDLVRPQRTRLVDPDVKFPPERFETRAQAIRALARSMVAQGLADRVYEFLPGDQLGLACLRKYAGPIVRESHDFAGCGFASYLIGLEAARTRYVLHYDADILLRQRPGQDWCLEGVAAFARDESIVSVCPASCPPLELDERAELDHRNRHGVATERTPLGWRSGWFSMRCALLDKVRLSRYLPLVRGRYAAMVLLRRMLDRTYPPPLEVMMYETVRRMGGRRLELACRESWYTHPLSKDDEWLRCLPQLGRLVRAGAFPDEQRGRDNHDARDWRDLLREEKG